MNDAVLSVREIQQEDIPAIINYWMTADAEYLKSMGADINKLPKEEQWMEMLSAQLKQSYNEKQSYCIIWELNGEAIGHSNVNRIAFGDYASMHLHIWKKENRKLGFGPAYIKMSIPFFFKNLQLKKLICEPYALNPAPNKVLEKAGFEFVKEYITTPGNINFEQPVNLWELNADGFLQSENKR